MNAIANKRILFFSQYFFGYEQKIKDKMNELGAKVDMFDEMSVSSSLARAINKLSPNLLLIHTRKYYARILSSISNQKYDYILFIDCDMPDRSVLKKLKKQFPEAKLCLHMWDSLKNLHNVNKKLELFDYVSSFDRYDAESHSLVFRPLFFCDEYQSNSTSKEKEYDICFIGTIHSDRYKVIKNLLSNLDARIYIYPYLQSKFIYWFYWLFKSEFRKTSISDFKYKKLDSHTIADIVDKSTSVLDIQHPDQNGLTIRTIEMIGMNKKLITTNQDIVNYDFFDENNIAVIDRKSPNISKQFFAGEYATINETVKNRYSISSWIYDVLGV